MRPPRVTFVIPCYNHGAFVGEAVRSCLAQKDAAVRVVVVDDGSDDGSTPGACDACTRLDPERVVVVHQGNAGLSAARNRGAAEARKRGIEWAGEYLTFLDADDYVDPTFVTKLHGAIVASSLPPDPAHTGAPAPGVVSHAYCQERLVGLADMVWAVPEWNAKLMMVTNLHPVTALVRRECFEAAGGFDESMRGGYEDWDLWLKFIEKGWRGVRVREPLFTWRRHSPSTMIVEAGERHGGLYAQLVRNHPDLYRRYADELLVLANTLLRRGEGNWLDESGEAIVQRDLRRLIGDLTRARDHTAHLLGVAQGELAAARDQARVLQEQGVERERALIAAGEREKSLAAWLRNAHDRGTVLEEQVRALTEREKALVQEAAALRARIAEAVAEAERVQREYEAKPIVRLSKRVYRVLDRMPGVIKRMARGTVNAVAGAGHTKTAPHGRG